MGKGAKERIVPFNSTAADAIRAWLRDRASLVESRIPNPKSRIPTGTRHPRLRLGWSLGFGIWDLF
jgi:integrase